MTNTANLNLPLMDASSTQKSLDYNEAVQVIDALLTRAVNDYTLTAPPGSPAEGSTYAVPTGATGDWAGRAGDLAIFAAGGWQFVTPKDGASLRDLNSAQDIARDGTSWVVLAPRNVVHSIKTANYILTDVDVLGGAVIGMDSASALVVTVPPSLPVGQPVTIYAKGAGAVSLVAGAGVVINSSDSRLGLRVKSSIVSLIPIAADEYLLGGDLV